MSAHTEHCFVKYIICAVSLALLLLLCFYYFLTPRFLNFSDTAKFADVARNIVENGLYGTKFAFYQASWQEVKNGLYSTNILPVYPLVLALSFKMFGIADFSILLTSSIFYVFSIVLIFLLGRKLFSNLIGFLAALATATSVSFLDYATNGASEVIFIFEILLTTYLFSLKEKRAHVAGVVVLFLMYFTRPQAFIYIFGLILFRLLLSFDIKKTIVFLVTGLAFWFLFDLFMVKSIRAPYVYSILGRSGFAVGKNLLGESASISLRTPIQSAWHISTILKKAFYNLYNFYKLLPQIASPYMWALFVIGLFKWGKDKVGNSLKIATIFMVVATFLVTALTIPFFRYLHPVIPLVYLFATATLVWIVGKMVKKRLVAIVSTLLIIFFVVGQTLGIIFLDSRFKAARTNRGKPPVYVKLSYILRDNTEPEDIIITNLDTWGSWYGERKTVWFPLKPEQLELQGEVLFDAIYLTSYLIDDENYYMGDEWRQIFYNPEKPEDRFIAENFELKGVYQVSAEETYEKQGIRAVLLVKKRNTN